MNILVHYFNCPAQREALVDFPENPNQNVTSNVLRVLKRYTENSIPECNGNLYTECYKNGSEIFGGRKCIEAYLVINNHCQSKMVIYVTFLLYVSISVSLLILLFHLFLFLIKFLNTYPLFSLFFFQQKLIYSFIGIFIYLSGRCFLGCLVINNYCQSKTVISSIYFFVY